jgi:hypothetical protein
MAPQKVIQFHLHPVTAEMGRKSKRQKSSANAWAISAEERAAGKRMGDSPIEHAFKIPNFDPTTVRFGWVGV